jgi:ornithine cyclodeaminase/alanine dehydrogenase-like protein (mu-crystallin family)
MSHLLVLSEHDVHELLTLPECIAVMEDALASLGRGEVHNPLRQIVRGPGAVGMLGLMPAYRGGERPFYGLKEVCVFPGNPARGLDSHLGAVLLHDGETGELLAAMNASAITAIRTAAVSAVATKLLAREDAAVLAIVGTGVQGQMHAAAIPLVRPIREIRMFSRNARRAGGPPAPVPPGQEQDRQARLSSTTTTTTIAATAEECVRGADIIVTATSSREPVLRREWLSPGVHINAVGSSIAAARELDGATVAAAALFVDRCESMVNESGDYLFALQEGAIAGPEHIRAELGELLTGQAQGRRSPDEITLFKSLGLAIEDLASASFLYEKATRLGRGTVVDW